MPNDFESELEREIRLEVEFGYAGDCSVYDLTYYTEGRKKEVSYERVRRIMNTVFSNYASAIEEMITKLLSLTCNYAPICKIDYNYLTETLGSTDFVGDLIDDVYNAILDNYIIYESYDAFIKSAISYARSHGLVYNGHYDDYGDYMDAHSYIMPNEPWNAFVEVIQEMNYDVELYDMGFYVSPDARIYIHVLKHKVKPSPECMSNIPSKECIMGD